MEYTVKQISAIIGRSEQTLYKVFKKKGIQELVDDTAHCRLDEVSKIKYYDEAILDAICKRYGIEKKELVEDSVVGDNPENADAESPQYTALLEEKLAEKSRRIKRLKKENERLKAEIDRLLTIIEGKEEKEKGYLVSIMSSMKKEQLLLEDDTKKKHWWSKRK